MVRRKENLQEFNVVFVFSSRILFQRTKLKVNKIDGRFHEKKNEFLFSFRISTCLRTIRQERRWKHRRQWNRVKLSVEPNRNRKMFLVSDKSCVLWEWIQPTKKSPISSPKSIRTVNNKATKNKNRVFVFFPRKSKIRFSRIRQFYEQTLAWTRSRSWTARSFSFVRSR